VDRQKPTMVWQGPRAGRGFARTDCYFVRVRVENQGRTRAEKVQVSAERLAKLGLDDKYDYIPTILPLNLKWSNSEVGAAAILDGISPKMGAFCEIVALCDPKNPFWPKPAGTSPDEAVAKMQLEVEPSDDWYLLPPGTYRLTLRISAANVVPIDKTFEFKHAGWVPDDKQMRRDCLAISLK
jgi:hypothetical protein